MRQVIPGVGAIVGETAETMLLSFVAVYGEKLCIRWWPECARRYVDVLQFGKVDRGRTNNHFETGNCTKQTHPSSPVARCSLFDVQHETCVITLLEKKNISKRSVVGFNQAVTCNGVLHTWSHQSSQTKLIFYYFFLIAYVCVYMLSQLRDLKTMSGLEWKFVLSYACTHLCRRVCLKWRVIYHWGASFFEDVSLVEYIYLVLTHMPGGVTVGDSGLCCRVHCLSSAIISLCLLI